MKIISINIWNGRLYQELKIFFNKYGNEVDVFCLQEVFSAHNIPLSNDFLDTPQKIKDVLGNNYISLTDNNG